MRAVVAPALLLQARCCSPLNEAVSCPSKLDICSRHALVATFFLMHALLPVFPFFFHSNILKRMIEAAGRGLWSAEPGVLARLKEMYGEMDDLMEGVTKG